MTELPLIERWFEDTAVGDPIGPVEYGPMTVMHLVRWASALENWHRIHYDHPFCTENQGLPGPVVNGTWKQQVIAQLLKEWAGPTGWLRKVEFQFRDMDVVGEVLRVQGRVAARSANALAGEVGCEVQVVNGSGSVTTVGSATVVLPLRGGPDLAYPYLSEEVTGDAPLGQPTPAGSCPAQFQPYIGVRSETLVSTDAVDASSLRRFTQAIMTRDPDYLDPMGAGARRFGSVVAPPLYPLHALHVPADAPDPLEVARDNPDFDGASQTPWSTFGLPEPPGAPRRILNGGNRVVLSSFAPLGTHVAVTSRYEDIYEKQGRSGSLLFLLMRSDASVHETGQPLLTSWQTTILR